MTKPMDTGAVARRKDAPPSIAALIAQQTPAIMLAMSGATPEQRQKNAERFTRVALTTIRNNPDLLKANPPSLLGALMTSASLNLEIDPRGLAYLVPYKGQVQLQIGYKGLKELAYRTGKVKSIYDEVVYRREVEAGNVTITVGLERDLAHRVDLLKPELREESKENPIILAYAVAVLADGSRHFEYVNGSEVAKRKKASQAAGSSYSPWNTWEAEMWKKTAVKKLARALPQATEYAVFHKAVALDEQADAGSKQDLDLPEGMEFDVIPGSAEDLDAKLKGKANAQAHDPEATAQSSEDQPPAEDAQPGDEGHDTGTLPQAGASGGDGLSDEDSRVLANLEEAKALHAKLYKRACSVLNVSQKSPVSVAGAKLILAKINAYLENPEQGA